MLAAVLAAVEPVDPVAVLAAVEPDEVPPDDELAVAVVDEAPAVPAPLPEAVCPAPVEPTPTVVDAELEEPFGWEGVQLDARTARASNQVRKSRLHSAVRS